MANDLWTPKISAYVDNELSERETLAMETHLRECAACAVEALQQTRLKRATKFAGQRYEASAEFRSKLAAQIAAKKPARWRWLWLPALSAAVIVLLVAGFLLNRSFQQAHTERLLAELTDIHVGNLAASTPVDVVSSDRHTVKPWFQGKIPFTFDLPELAGSSFSLAGGRVAYLDHEPGALLVYNGGAHHISVFIFREQPEFSRSFSAREASLDALNFRVDSWSENGLRYFVVGDASQDAMRQLTVLLKHGT